jgi:hypothetical protein
VPKIKGVTMKKYIYGSRKEKYLNGTFYRIVSQHEKIHLQCIRKGERPSWHFK